MTIQRGSNCPYLRLTHLRAVVVGLLFGLSVSIDGADIRGRVVDDARQPVADALITLAVEGVSVRSDQTGHFELLTTAVSSRQAGPQPHGISVAPDGAISLRLSGRHRVSAGLFSISGRSLGTVFDGWCDGATRIAPPSANLAGALYLISLQIDGQRYLLRVISRGQGSATVFYTETRSGPQPRTMSKLLAMDESDTLLITKEGYDTARIPLGTQAPVDLGDIVLSRELNVTVMSFNVRVPVDGYPNDWNTRKGMVFTVIDTYAPDLLGCQELVESQERDILAACPAYRSWGVGREAGGGGESCKIFYNHERWRIDGENSGTFWYGPTPDVAGTISWGASYPRICTYARVVNTSSGRALYLYNSHWDHQSVEARNKSAAQLVDFIARRSHPDEPWIATGDLNAGEQEASVVYLRERGGMQDTYRALYPAATNAGTFHGFGGGQSGAKIDFVMSPATGCTVQQAEIIHYSEQGRYPSDHFPVWAAIGFSRPATALARRVVTSR